MKHFVAAIFGFFIFGCSSAPMESSSPTPEWVSAPTRTVDNGYIVYVGSGEDSSKDRASFKAEGAALADLANECSFVPKGARLEDRFDKTEGALHESYAKVAVEFQFCEEAKKTVDPDSVRKLASQPMTEQIKKYQEMLGQPPDLDAVAKAESMEGVPEVEGAPATSTVAYGGPIRSDIHFFVIREQVAEAKQVVILSPPSTYMPGAPATNTYMHAVTQPMQQIASYAAAHPEIQKTPHGWSSHQSEIREIDRSQNPHYRSPYHGLGGKGPHEKGKAQSKSNQGHGRHRRKNTDGQ